MNHIEEIINSWNETEQAQAHTLLNEIFRKKDEQKARENINITEQENQLISNGRTIEAIRAIRQRTGNSLSVCKTAVELQVLKNNEPPELEDNEKILILGGNIVEAIKLLRLRKKMSLSQAFDITKEFKETYEKEGGHILSNTSRNKIIERDSRASKRKFTEKELQESTEKILKKEAEKGIPLPKLNEAYLNFQNAEKLLRKLDKTT